jgi:hypothetical protein
MRAESICGDDANTGEYPARAYDMLGPFDMGRLDWFSLAEWTGVRRSFAAGMSRARWTCSTTTSAA